MKSLIINADDFGYSAGVNAGIIQSHKNGILTSTTLMANMPGTLDAIQQAKNYPNLGVGAHLVLTTGKSLISHDTNLVDPFGNFHHLSEYPRVRTSFSDEDIFDEWCAQIDFLIDNGVPLTHFDSHHHVHFFPENHDITRRISEKYQLVFRNSYGTEDFSPHDFKQVNDLLLDMMNTPVIRDMSQSYELLKESCFEELAATFSKGMSVDVLEMMVHPAFVDEHLYNNSSFNLQRIREIEILTDPLTQQLITDLGFRLTRYDNALETTQEFETILRGNK